jgi:hypothetical protein
LERHFRLDRDGHLRLGFVRHFHCGVVFDVLRTNSTEPQLVRR